jgi:hypothetical protein
MKTSYSGNLHWSTNTEGGLYAGTITRTADNSCNVNALGNRNNKQNTPLVLNLCFCVMEPFDSLAKPTDPFSEKFI